eukprot:jgi/Botrbrau1/19150/Bobra.0077s0062.1
MHTDIDEQPYTICESLEHLNACAGDCFLWAFEGLHWFQQYLLHGQVLPRDDAKKDDDFWSPRAPLNAPASNFAPLLVPCQHAHVPGPCAPQPLFGGSTCFTWRSDARRTHHGPPGFVPGGVGKALQPGNAAVRPPPQMFHHPPAQRLLHGLAPPEGPSPHSKTVLPWDPGKVPPDHQPLGPMRMPGREAGGRQSFDSFPAKAHRPSFSFPPRPLPPVRTAGGPVPPGGAPQGIGDNLLGYLPSEGFDVTDESMGGSSSDGPSSSVQVHPGTPTQQRVLEDLGLGIANAAAEAVRQHGMNQPVMGVLPADARARRTSWGAPLAAPPARPGEAGVSRVKVDEALGTPRAPAEGRQAPRDALARAVPQFDIEEIEMGRVIGTGAFGQVRYALCQGQELAVKVLTVPDTDAISAVVEEFEKEVAMMAALPFHRNVLPLLGACVTPPTLALVTPFCARGSLYSMLHKQEERLTWAQRLYMCLGAAKGMMHLHSCNVLHRDLKSGNLLVDADYTVKVADFGLSRVVHGVQTMTGGLGTYQWMAPEVLANLRYSQKADTYSFAIVMWECASRKVPYEGLNGLQAAIGVLERGLRPEIPAGTVPALARLMQECWAPVPEQRPSFDQIVPRLQAIFESVRTP